MNEISYKDLKVFHLQNKRLKNSYIQVKPQKDGLGVEVLLKTPRISARAIEDMLEAKESWIRLQISKILQNPPLQPRLEDEVQLFGAIYSIDDPIARDLYARLMRVKTTDQEKILSCYDAFYKQISYEYLQQRAEYFAHEMQLSYHQLKVRKMKSRWGSCSSKKIITYNTQLMKIEKSLIDYVVVHELAHLVHMNHSKAFHDLVSLYLPDAKLLRSKLKSITLL